jgi:hypothetical protein
MNEGDEEDAAADDLRLGAKTKNLAFVDNPKQCMLRTALTQSKVRHEIGTSRTKAASNAFRKAYSMCGTTPGILGFEGMDQPAGE